VHREEFVLEEKLQRHLNLTRVVQLMKTDASKRSQEPRLPGSVLAHNLYFKCFETSLVISNMFTVDFPPNTIFKTASALIIRLFFGSCSLFFLIYAHSRLVTSVRGIGFEPTIAVSAGPGVTGFMNAALGLREGDFFEVLAIWFL